MKYHELETSTQVILKVVLAGLVLVFLWLTRDILLILLLALILASAMEPMVAYFNERRIPRAVSVLTVYVLVLALVGLVVYLITPPLVAQLKVLKDNLPQYGQQFQDRLGSTVFSDVSLADLVQEIFPSNFGQNTVVSGTFGVFNGFFTVITVLVISFYLVAQRDGMQTFVRALVPEKHQDFYMGMISKIQVKMGRWIIGQFILSFSIFVLSLIGLTILKVKYALFLALLAGLLEVVPYIGPFLSAIPAVFFAFLQSPPLALVVAILYLIIQKTEGYVLVPKIMEKTVGTSPLVVLLALLVGFKLAGIIGLLIAVPLVSAITVVVNEFLAEKASA